MKHSLLFLVFVVIILFLSCNKHKLEEPVMSALSDDFISENEVKELYQAIQEKREYRSLKLEFPSLDSLRAEIQSIALENGVKNPFQQGSGVDAIPVKEGPNSAKYLNEPLAYDVYIENSGSMYGYFTGNTAFKDAFMDLCTRIKRQSEDLHFHFVNDQLHSIKGELDGFMHYLEPKSESKLREKGNVNRSNLADIFQIVTRKLKPGEESRPVILCSDFILSLDKPSTKLSTQKYSITSLLVSQDLAKNGYGILVIKNNSFFDGKYYPYNSPFQGTEIEKKRPYYIWVIDKVENLLYFPQKYTISSLKGYMNHYLIYNLDKEYRPYYSILKETEKKGEFDLIDKDTKVIHEIKNIKFPNRRDKIFQFALAIDLSDISATEQYLLNANHYSVTSSKGDEFVIKAIKKREELRFEDKDRRSNYMKGATHILLLSSKKVSPGKNKLSIKLKDETPQWILDSSTDDDTQTEGSSFENTTFGLKYLMEGVMDAFLPVEKSDRFFFPDRCGFG